jgi:hypothetical protein
MSALAGKNRQSNVSDSSTDNKKSASKREAASIAGNPLWTSISTYTAHSNQSPIQAKPQEKGNVLEGSARAPMERSFGQSFDDVRVYNSPSATATAVT